MHVTRRTHLAGSGVGAPDRTASRTPRDRSRLRSARTRSGHRRGADRAAPDREAGTDDPGASARSARLLGRPCARCHGARIDDALRSRDVRARPRDGGGRRRRVAGHRRGVRRPWAARAHGDGPPRCRGPRRTRPDPPGGRARRVGVAAAAGGGQPRARQRSQGGRRSGSADRDERARRDQTGPWSTATRRRAGRGAVPAGRGALDTRRLVRRDRRGAGRACDRRRPRGERDRGRAGRWRSGRAGRVAGATGPVPEGTVGAVRRSRPIPAAAGCRRPPTSPTSAVRSKLAALSRSPRPAATTCCSSARRAPARRCSRADWPRSCPS